MDKLFLVNYKTLIKNTSRIKKKKKKKGDKLLHCQGFVF